MIVSCVSFTSLNDTDSFEATGGYVEFAISRFILFTQSPSGV